MPIPYEIRVENPNTSSVLFAGQFVNISGMGRLIGVDPSHLSKVFKGKRVPTLQQALLISKTLGLTVEQFCTYLEFLR